LIGSIDTVVERFLAQRDRHGISHNSVYPVAVEAIIRLRAAGRALE
jgi:hypothetical protein